MQLIDPAQIKAHFELADGFHHPDWEKIWKWIEGNVAEENREEAWNEAARLWLLSLRDELGGGYHLRDSEESFVLSDYEERMAARLHVLVDRTVKQVENTLGETAWNGSFGKRAAIIFGEQDDFFQYISHFSIEGEHPSGGGVSVSRGFTHIALPRTTGETVNQTIIHELTHDALAYLTLPLWLNEGVAQFMERNLGQAYRETVVDHELVERHAGFWTEENIQEFWAGTSFYVPGDANELSYNLAEVLFHLLIQENRKSPLKPFFEQVTPEGAGQEAAMKWLNLDLGKLAGTFLGPGNWGPNREAIEACWERAGWSASDFRAE